MLAAVGVDDIEDLYEEIPAALRMQRPLDLPAPLTSEADLVRHVEALLNRNTSTRETVSFLGAGCYDHHVPAVCDEVNGRAEFLTAYAGEPYEDHGRFQALFEYVSMMGELPRWTSSTSRSMTASRRRPPRCGWRPAQRAGTGSS